MHNNQPRVRPHVNSQSTDWNPHFLSAKNKLGDRSSGCCSEDVVEEIGEGEIGGGELIDDGF
jgi:hypothetical protein